MPPNPWLIYHNSNPWLDFSLSHSLVVDCLSLSYSLLLNNVAGCFKILGLLVKIGSQF